MRTLLRMALGSLGLLLAMTSVVPAQAAASPSPYTLRLQVAPRPDKPEALTLTANLTGGTPPAGSAIAFYVVTTEFGQEMELSIGSADLARNGSASVGYTPTWAGSQKFVAKLIADGGSAPTTGGAPSAVTATATYTVTGSPVGPLYAGANAPRPFSPIGRVFLTALLTTVALVWLTLLTVLVRVFIRLPKLAETS